jgi:CBS domain-containing protein
MKTLPIRLRSVIDEDGDAGRLEPLVHCPRRGASVDARRCIGCARMRTMQWDPSEGGEVVCAPPDDDAATRPPTSGRMDLQETTARTALHEVAGLVTTCVAPGASIARVRDLFVEKGLRCAAVVDSDVKLLGVISRSDLLDAAPDAKVRDIMAARVHALPEHAPIGYAVALMAFEDISEVPVVTDSGELVGLWTALDALRWVAEHIGYVKPARQA